MRENHCRKFYPDTDIHAVGLCGNLHIPADLFHPLAAASSYGYNTLFTGIGSVFTICLIAILADAYGFHRRVKEKRHFVFQLLKQVFQHNKVNVGP